MKKNNWIVLSVALIACVALLVTYFVLGFHHVHALDIVLAVIWIVMIVAAGVAFKLTGEKDSQERSEEGRPAATRSA